MAFSPDGYRIVTGCVDGTAKVWDARTGTPLLELTGHTNAVTSAAFSPDGARIVTGGDRSVRVWDARTGALLLELKGHTPEVYRAHFSPDGGRIFTASAISVRPEEEERAYRIHLMRPNWTRYREGYDAAIASGDEFAARFYLNLFPPAERARMRAEPIVKSLLARWLFRDDVLAALQSQPVADPEVQTACRELATTWAESAKIWDYEHAARSLVRVPGQPEAIYRRGLRLAEAAVRMNPGHGRIVATLGMAQYRCGLMAAALGTLTRSNELNRHSYGPTLAFLALVQHRMGLSDSARETLGRLRAIMKNDPEQAGNAEFQAYLREAEAIELDGVFPSDPFAP